MSKILALCARELRSQIVSPVVWLVATLYLFAAGYFFFGLVSSFSTLVQNYTYYAQVMSNPALLDRLNLNDVVVAGLFRNLVVLYLFFVPILTMRTFAEERKLGTDELLLTAPVTPGQIVAGKYLGALAVVSALTASTGLFVALLLRHGSPEWGPILSGMLGLFLLAAALTALGLAVSSQTDSQVLAAVGAFVLSLLLFVLDWAAEFVEGGKRAFLEALSLPGHLENFTKGLITSPDVVYFLSLVALGLFVARATVASARWR